MLMLVVVVLVGVVARLRGGSLRHFSALRLRLIPVVLSSLLVQLLIFTPFRESSIIPVATTQLYLISMGLLVIWVAANWHIPGMALMAAGMLMNLAAIAANGGYMPVSPESARYAGTSEMYAETGVAIANNSIAADSGVNLWLLTDILALPKEVPFANVFSIGDVLITLGASLLCYLTIRRAPEGYHANRETPEAHANAAPIVPRPSSNGAVQLAHRLHAEIVTMETLLDQDIDAVAQMSSELTSMDSRLNGECLHSPETGAAEDAPEIIRCDQPTYDASADVDRHAHRRGKG